MNQNLTSTIENGHWKEQAEICKQESENLASKVEILTNQCSSGGQSSTSSDDTTGIN